VLSSLAHASQIAKVATNADVPVDAQSVAAFFSGGVCALRNADDGPTEASLCSACTVSLAQYELSKSLTVQPLFGWQAGSLT
jgi:hypothetical protein